MSYGKNIFESLLALVKAYIIDIWEERKSKLYGDVECAQQPHLHSPTGDLGEIAQVSCILYVAPPTPVGAWSMAWGYGSVLSIIIIIVCLTYHHYS